MIALTWLFWMSAALSPQCHSAGQQRACGYHCKVGLGSVVCAQTPEGICAAIAGKFVCWDPPPSVREHPPKISLAPVCKEKRGQIACGFHCEESSTQVRCAKTPYGICVSKFDDVWCWDPSEALIHAVGKSLPSPQCVAATPNKVACGYICEFSRNRAVCSQTPMGSCSREGDDAQCFDPPLSTSDHHLHGS